MQRMGMVIGVKPEMIAEYKRLHAAVWPEVLALISDCNIRNYTIFLREPENLAVWLLGISWHRFQRRYGEDGGQPQEPGMVVFYDSLPETARKPQGRRVVGYDGRDLPPRLNDFHRH